jgi:hypothetical protein
MLHVWERKIVSKVTGPATEKGNEDWGLTKNWGNYIKLLIWWLILYQRIMKDGVCN